VVQLSNFLRERNFEYINFQALFPISEYLLSSSIFDHNEWIKSQDKLKKFHFHYNELFKTSQVEVNFRIHMCNTFLEGFYALYEYK